MPGVGHAIFPPFLSPFSLLDVTRHHDFILAFWLFGLFLTLLISHFRLSFVCFFFGVVADVVASIVVVSEQSFFIDGRKLIDCVSRSKFKRKLILFSFFLFIFF